MFLIWKFSIALSLCKITNNTPNYCGKGPVVVHLSVLRPSLYHGVTTSKTALKSLRFMWVCIYIYIHVCTSIGTFITPFCYWWLITMKKCGWMLTIVLTLTLRGYKSAIASIYLCAYMCSYMYNRRHILVWTNIIFTLYWWFKPGNCTLYCIYIILLMTLTFYMPVIHAKNVCLW